MTDFFSDNFKVSYCFAKKPLHEKAIELRCKIFFIKNKEVWYGNLSHWCRCNGEGNFTQYGHQIVLLDKDSQVIKSAKVKLRRI